MEQYGLAEARSRAISGRRKSGFVGSVPMKERNGKVSHAAEGDGLNLQFVNQPDPPHRTYKNVAPTLATSKDSTGVVVRGKDGKLYARHFTAKEAYALQGFPGWAYDRVKASGQSEAQMFKEAGNSIAVPVLREIFHTIDDEDIRLDELATSKKKQSTTKSARGSKSKTTANGELNKKKGGK